MNEYIKQKRVEFDAIIEYFKKDILTLRVGRANPSVLDGIVAESYGTMTPLNNLANISVIDSKCMTVTPWDKNNLKDIEKAIVEADLGFGIMNEGDKVRINIPSITEDNRKDLVKKLHEKHEQARIKIRQVRDEVKVNIEKAENEKEISEDDKFRFIKELDEEILKINEEIKTLTNSKEEEIMTV